MTSQEQAEQARQQRAARAAAMLAQDGTPEPKSGLENYNNPAYLAAEKLARDVAGSGFNAARAATLAADRAAAAATREKYGKA